MFFKITSNINVPASGDVFFTAPTKEEIEKAIQIMVDLCNEKIENIYKEQPIESKKLISNRLNYEIDKIRSTETPYHFLILKEIAELSREEGYPVVALGDLSGSIVSYLLGITEFPFSINSKHYVPEFVWGTDANPKSPDFTIGISHKIRPLINERLNSKYGTVKCDDEIFKQITLANADTCERLGELSKEYGKLPDNCEFTNEIYLRVAKSITDEFLEENGQPIPLFEETTQQKDWNFDVLVRLYAFTKGGFNSRNPMLNFNDSNFFVTREEFFKILVQHSVPSDVALDIVKNGVWATGEKRNKYVEVLESHHIPESIKNNFANVNHLWTAASCVGRVLHKCYLAWYQEMFDIKPEFVQSVTVHL